ncbi:peptidase [Streptomyces sp. A7024]|uniref:Peptidase n=1 Tax=Streptomyces coryli TaxID=1128680 RepID=A0A6G4U7L3_9ACTN|nr:Clp protease N-terminal domain-containing protein [Streptomyces coryli]NGN67287.1 peptidase [Streptomyces coryli]
MFERFTRAAKDVVRGAAEAAERRGDAWVTEEHLVLVLLAGQGTRAADALAALGVDRAAVERELDAARQRGGLSKSDAEALAGIGIDVAEIVGRVEEAHGAGVLGAQPRGRRWRDGRFDQGAKKVLERSLKVALGRGDKQIGDEHLLLALLSAPGPAAEVLADQGAGYGDVERVLRKAA